MGCAHCGRRKANRGWNVAPCAMKPRAINEKLCGPCDKLLNEIVMDFFQVRGRRKLIERYRHPSQEQDQ